MGGLPSTMEVYGMGEQERVRDQSADARAQRHIDRLAKVLVLRQAEKDRLRQRSTDR